MRRRCLSEWLNPPKYHPLSSLWALLAVIGVSGCGSAPSALPLEQAAHGVEAADPGPETSGAPAPLADAGPAAADASDGARSLPVKDAWRALPRIGVCASSPGVQTMWDGRHRLALHAVVTALEAAAQGADGACPAVSSEQRISFGDELDTELWRNARALELLGDDGSQIRLAFQLVAQSGLPELGTFAFDEQPGDEVDLVVESNGATSGTLELRHSDGSLSAWAGMAWAVDGLQLPAELQASTGSTEYRADGECNGRASEQSADQTLAFSSIDVTIEGQRHSVGSGEQLLSSRYVFTNAGLSTPLDPGHCGKLSFGLAQAALWSVCHDVTQLGASADDGADPAAPQKSGLSSCGAQLFVQTLPDTCGSDRGELVSGDSGLVDCTSDDDCEDDARCRDSHCERPPECMTQSDCADGQVCLCAGATSDRTVVAFNQCVPADCTEQSDCGAFECAASAAQDCSGRVLGLYCQKSGDACQSLDECQGSCSRADDESWQCSAEPVCQ
jgi:hypothetical protein